MTEPRLKVAVLSFAHTHAGGYLRLLGQRADVDVLASDPDGVDGQRGAAYAAAHGARYVDTYAEVFAWRPDAVIICSENARHAELVSLAAAHGAQILCEKPLATTVADAQAAIAAADAAGVRLMTAYPVRFAPAFAELKALVNSGALGEIVSIVGTNNGKLPAQRSWFTDPDLAGGGALVDHVVHCADLLDELLGASPASVYAVANAILYAEPGLRVETGGLVTLRYADGVIASIDCSWSLPPNAPTWGGLTLTVTGTLGSVRIDPFASHVAGFDADGAVWLPFGVNLDALLLEEFLGSIRDGRDPQPDGRTGARSLAVVVAAQTSVREGRVVRLDG